MKEAVFAANASPLQQHFSLVVLLFEEKFYNLARIATGQGIRVI